MKLVASSMLAGQGNPQVLHLNTLQSSSTEKQSYFSVNTLPTQPSPLPGKVSKTTLNWNQVLRSPSSGWALSRRVISSTTFQAFSSTEP